MKVQETAPEKSQMAKIVTRGRKTGLPHIVLARYVIVNGSFCVLGGKASSDWVLNARASGHAKLRIGEYVYEVSASPVVGQEMSTVRAAFERKYGERTYREWYSGSEACLRFTPESGPQVRGAVLGEGDTQADFQTWKGLNTDYYQRVATAFDSASEEYDFTINQNFINRWIRRRSVAELLRVALPSDVLLEIGCGTGAEAIEISSSVSGIVATDISERMIDRLRTKVRARGLTDKISAWRCGANEISRVSSQIPGGRVRVAYSFNGALNCEPRVERFPAELSKVLEDGGYFLCSIRNTLCLSEMLAHALALQLDRMAPRKRQPVMVSVGGMDVPSYYYSPSRFAAFFYPHFRLRRLIALPGILPPAYLSNMYVRARKVLSVAERAEGVLASRFPLNRFGDQTLFVFEKTERATGS